MTTDQTWLQYQQSSPRRKLLVLSLLAHNLTVAARGAWSNNDASADQIVRKLIGLNELQHTVSGTLLALAGDGEGYPDDAFLDVLFETAEIYHCEADLQQAFAWTLRAEV